MTQAAANFHTIMEKIAEATLRARRDVRDVRLLGAAKSQSVESVRAAIGAGLALIGENYVQEAHATKAQIEAPVEWHMIGHLQRNKVKAALDLFDVVESLDSFALARELDKEGKRRGTVIRAFIEVNLAGEKSKSGIGKSQLAMLL